MSNYPALPETDTYIIRVLKEKDGVVTQQFVCDWSHDKGMVRSSSISAAAINSKEWSEHVIATEQKMLYNEGYVFQLVKVSFTL